MGNIQGVNEILVTLVKENCSLVGLPERLVPVHCLECTAFRHNPEGVRRDASHPDEFVRSPAP